MRANPLHRFAAPKNYNRYGPLNRTTYPFRPLLASRSRAFCTSLTLAKGPVRTRCQMPPPLAARCTWASKPSRANCAFSVSASAGLRNEAT